MLSATEIWFKYRERSQKTRNVTPMTLDVKHYWHQTYWQSGRKKRYLFGMQNSTLSFYYVFCFQQNSAEFSQVNSFLLGNF